MTRVLVVHEVRAICETLAIALRSQADLEVVGGATDLGQAVTHLNQCDLALVNASLTTVSSTRLVHGLRRLAPRVKMVIMGVARSPYAIFQCIQAGVAGYVLADSTLDEVLESLRAAVHGQAHILPPSSAAPAYYTAVTTDDDASEDPADCGPQSLTRREREVLTLVQQGLTNQEIAASLVIELGTVKNHVHNILRKLNVSSRRDAVRVSRLAGLKIVGETGNGPWLMSRPSQARAALQQSALLSPALGANN